MAATSRAQQIHAVVLRSFRYSETSLIVHFYSCERGYIAGIARGARRPKSRFGGRLEPFFHLDASIHVGRSELVTIAGVATIAPYSRLRLHRSALQQAAYACQAVDKLFHTGEPHPDVYHLLVNFLQLLDSDPDSYANMTIQLAFRVKLLVAAGFTPELSVCAVCGCEQEQWGHFSAQAGGVLCVNCYQASSGYIQVTSRSLLALRTMLGTAMKNLVQAPKLDQLSIREIETLLHSIVSFHAHVHLPEMSSSL